MDQVSERLPDSGRNQAREADPFATIRMAGKQKAASGLLSSETDLCSYSPKNRQPGLGKCH